MNKTSVSQAASALAPVCPACRKGALHPANRIQVFEPLGKRVEVSLLTSVCDHCGQATTRAAQHRENLQRLAERKQHYGYLLLGEEVLALRKRYGLTQQEAAKVFGKGKIAFSRYENETSYPDETTSLMLRMALDQPASIKWLADQAGVELPLWAERCEDERKRNACPLSIVAPLAGAAHTSPKRHESFVVADKLPTAQHLNLHAMPASNMRRTISVIENQRVEGNTVRSTYEELCGVEA